MLQAALCGTQGYWHGCAGANERSRQGADMTHSDTILSLPILSVGVCLLHLHCLALVLVVISSCTIAEAFNSWSVPHTPARIND